MMTVGAGDLTTVVERIDEEVGNCVRRRPDRGPDAAFTA